MAQVLLLILECGLFFNVFRALAAEDTKLLFVQILFRHGDRAPHRSYPNDPNPETVWPEGFGKLTLLGKKQHYELGNLFRRMYQNFITSSPNEVNVTSSEKDRCLRSAETNVAAFYAPSPEWRFDGNVNWQPIPVTYIKESEDKYLAGTLNCPRIQKEMSRLQMTRQSQEILDKHKEMFRYLSIFSGEPIRTLIDAYYFYDTVSIEKKHNLLVPPWVEPHLQDLEAVADYAHTLYFHSPLLHRLFAGPLLGRIIDAMQSKLAGDIPLQKIQIYSAHDNNIAVVLDALNLYPMKNPPYCASLLFELHETTDGEKAVRLLYLNSTTPETGFQEPHVLVLDGCTESCPLDFFVEATKDLIPDDWERECQLPADNEFEGSS